MVIGGKSIAIWYWCIVYLSTVSVVKFLKAGTRHYLMSVRVNPVW